MQLHWLRDREQKNQFKVVWLKGKNIKADYFTKHHTTPHHRQQRPHYVRDSLHCLFSTLVHIYNNTDVRLQGCIEQSCDS